MPILSISEREQLVCTEIERVFKKDTAHTCTFEISESDMEALIKQVKAVGYNPYALMSW